MGSRMAVGAFVAVLALGAPTLAHARVLNAETVLPPGQSGFVPPAGQPENPHILDQLKLFEDFSFKPAGFDQPAASTETPRPGVTITRDAFGVPNVRAGSQDDAWFGAGYAVAQDRLVELELFRRSAEGTLAAVLGEGRLQSDIVARRDYYTKAELRRQLRKLPKSLRSRFDAYADGVNAWLARVAADPSVKPQELALLGLVPAKWTAVDSASIGVFLARTVPSDDGHELQNWRALKQLGAKPFARLLPLRQTGEPVTVPPSERRFPSQPGRTRRDERRGFRKSRRFLAKRSVPTVKPARASIAGQLPARGGSSHWALRGPGGQSFLFTGPQLGYSVPELFVELEVHAPGLDVRGVTAPGIPVIAAGHNGHIAWGVTSGLDDDDDLYVERLKGGKERYRFKGKTRKMKCRKEKFAVAGAKAVTRRFCRTVHGPVQLRSKGAAFARRYAIWNRELGTLRGLAELNDAGSVAAAGRALAKVTWNENTLVSDDAGHIGWWHPGRLPLRPRRWDERLPYPGTGEAEWRGVLKTRQLPKVVDPKQGWISNWNNSPSAGWTNGDMSAPEENVGPLNRGAFLERLVAAAAAAPSYEALKNVDRVAGTTSQQRPLMDARLRAAQAVASGPGRAVLDAIVAWDGNYDRVGADGKVDAGVAAFDALKDAAEGRLPAAAVAWMGQRGGSHPFDIGGAEAAELNAANAGRLASIAGDAATILQTRFGSADPAAWRSPRRMYDVAVQGVAPKPELKFYDRGTWQQAAALGP